MATSPEPSPPDERGLLHWLILVVTFFGLLLIAQVLAQPETRPAIRAAPVAIERVLTDSGLRIVITLPIADQGTTEQIVRFGRRRMMGAVIEVLTAFPEATEVHVVGTTPVNGVETPALTVFVTRDECALWDGREDSVPGHWEIHQHLCYKE